MNELMSDEAVYRTAPATPGLLITEEEEQISFLLEQFKEYAL